MLLEDFNEVSRYQLRTLNDILKNNYGVSISKDSSIRDLRLLENKVLVDNEMIKLRESRLHLDPTFSKNLLILESIRLMIKEKKELGETKVKYDSVYEKVLHTLVEYVAESIITENVVDIAGAIEVYKQTGYTKYNVKEIGAILESFFTDKDVLKEASERKWWTPGKDLRNSADEEYKKLYGDEPIDSNNWEAEPQNDNPEHFGGFNGFKSKTSRGSSTRAGRKLALQKHKPGMMNKLRSMFNGKS